MIDCPNNPIPIDIIWLANLTSGLTRIEDKLQRLLSDHYISLNANNTPNNNNNKTFLDNISTRYVVPSHMLRTVTMWHFGQDSLTEYSGEKVEIRWHDNAIVSYLFKRNP